MVQMQWVRPSAKRLQQKKYDYTLSLVCIRIKFLVMPFYDIYNFEPLKSRNDVCPCCPLENQTQPYPLNRAAADLFHMVLFPSRFRNIRNLTPNLLSDAYDKIVSTDVATFYEEQCSKIK